MPLRRRTSIRKCFAVFILIFAECLSAQKAEPVRIEFPRGSSSAVVHGRLRGRQQMEYVVRVKGGGTLALLLAAAPSGGLELRVHDAAGAEVNPRNSSPERWSAELVQAGDYIVSVVRVSNNPESS